MAKGITVPVVQSGLEASIEAAAKKAGPLTLSASVDPGSFKRLAQPLGRVSGLATEFEKSIAASNARVIAFGASVGIINGVQNAFATLVRTTIEVEKSLANIAIISGKTTQELEPFSRALFEIAKTTSQSFQTASEAALEFSRQGLGLEETLKRTQDALTLTRFTTLSAAEAVDVLTAAANSFGATGITTSEILNKLVAVDTKFAVSAEDLAKGLSRAGSIAQEVGVSFDELNAIVTIAQERTARGGAVIGNAFKTIFTRIRSDETIKALQSIGIYSFDAEGRLRPVVSLLEELAGKINTLSETKRIEVLEAIASKYNINVLTALVDDLGSTASKFREARDVSAGAQSEAYQRQIELNQTLDAVITRVTNSAAQLADTLGRIGVTDSLKSLLNFFDNILTGINDVIDSEGIGGTIAKGLISGLSGVFFKIGIPLLLAIFVKLTKDIAQFGTESLKTILGINKEVRERQALEQAVVNTLIKDQQVMATILSLSGDRRKQEEYLLSVYNRQLAALQQVQTIAAGVAPALQAAGLSATSGTVKRRAAEGYLPAAEAKDVRRGVGGASPSSKVVEIPNFSFGGGKRGTMVANTSEYIVPNYGGGSGTAIFNQDMAREYGLPSGAKKITAAGGFVPVNGFIPNYADNQPKNIKAIRQGKKFEENLNLKLFGEKSYAPNAVLDFPKPEGFGVDSQTKAQLGISPQSEYGDAKRTQSKKSEKSLLDKYLRTPEGSQEFLKAKETTRGFINLSPEGLSMLFLEEGQDAKKTAYLGTKESILSEKTKDLIKTKFGDTKASKTIAMPYIADKINKAVVFDKKASTGYIPNFAKEIGPRKIVDSRGIAGMIVPDKNNERVMEAYLNSSLGFETKPKTQDKTGIYYVKYHTYGLNEAAFEGEALKKGGDITNIEADVQKFGLDIAKKYSYKYASEYSRSLGGSANGVQISDEDVKKSFLASKGAVSGFSSLGGGIFETAIRTGVQGEINKDLIKAQQTELGAGKLDFKVTDVIKRLFGVNRGETEVDSKIEGNPKSTGRSLADQIVENNLYKYERTLGVAGSEKGKAAAGYVPNFAEQFKKQQEVLAPSGQFYDLDTADKFLEASNISLETPSTGEKGLGTELKQRILASAKKVYGPQAQIGISRLPGRREAFTSAVLNNPALADDFIALQRATTGGVGPVANTPEALAKFNNPTPFDPTPWPAVRAVGGKSRAVKKVGPMSLNAVEGYIPNFASQNALDAMRRIIADPAAPQGEKDAAASKLTQLSKVTSSGNPRTTAQKTVKAKLPITEEDKAYLNQNKEKIVAGMGRSFGMLFNLDALEVGDLNYVRRLDPVIAKKLSEIIQKQGGRDSIRSLIDFGSAARGYIPNFADNEPLKEAISREIGAGVPPARVRVTQDGRLKNRDNPNGLAVINTRDEPNGKIPNDFRERGMRAAMASRGFVPNFVEGEGSRVDFPKPVGMPKEEYKNLQNAANLAVAALKQGTISQEQLAASIAALGQQYKLSEQQLQGLQGAAAKATEKLSAGTVLGAKGEVVAGGQKKPSVADKITKESINQAFANAPGPDAGKSIDIGKFLVLQTAIVGATSAVQAFTEENSTAANVLEGVNAGLSGLATFAALATSVNLPLRILLAGLTGLASAAPLLSRFFESQKDPAEKTAEALAKLAKEAERTGQALTPETLLAKLAETQRQERVKTETTTVTKSIESQLAKRGITAESEQIGAINAFLSATGGVTRNAEGAVTGIDAASLIKLLGEGALKRTETVVSGGDFAPAETITQTTIDTNKLNEQIANLLSQEVESNKKRLSNRTKAEGATALELALINRDNEILLAKQKANEAIFQNQLRINKAYSDQLLEIDDSSAEIERQKGILTENSVIAKKAQLERQKADAEYNKAVSEAAVSLAKNLGAGGESIFGSTKEIQGFLGQLSADPKKVQDALDQYAIALQGGSTDVNALDKMWASLTEGLQSVPESLRQLQGPTKEQFLAFVRSQSETVRLAAATKGATNATINQKVKNDLLATEFQNLTRSIQNYEEILAASSPEGQEKYSEMLGVEQKKLTESFVKQRVQNKISLDTAVQKARIELDSALDAEALAKETRKRVGLEINAGIAASKLRKETEDKIYQSRLDVENTKLKIKTDTDLIEAETSVAQAYIQNYNGVLRENDIRASIENALTKIRKSEIDKDKELKVQIATIRASIDAEQNDTKRKIELARERALTKNQEDYNREATQSLILATYELAEARKRAIADLQEDNLTDAVSNEITARGTSNLREITRTEVEGRALTKAGVQLNFEQQAKAAVFEERRAGRTDLALRESTNILSGRDNSIQQNLKIQKGVLLDQAETFQQIIGNQTPKLFADGMAEAMQAALNQADDLGGALRNVALNFLKSLQSAFLQSASRQIVASILPSAIPTGRKEGGYVKGYATGGLVTGGSGYKDDVPAMLSEGEYVIRKSSVKKYGASNLQKLNSGEAPKFAAGGIFLPGIRGQTEISGYKDLTAFAKQTTTSGATDVLAGGATTAFANLEDQSSRLSAYALMREDDTINQEIRSAQEQAMNIMAEREAYRTAERKAFQKQLVGTIGSAALSFGVNAGIGKLGSLFNKAPAIPDIATNSRLQEVIAPYDAIGGKIGNLSLPSSNIPEVPDLWSRISGQSSSSYGSNALFSSKLGLSSMFASQAQNPFLQGLSAFQFTRPPGRAYGGAVKRYNAGGPTDDIPALLMGGEYVINRQATKKYGKQFFDSINQGRAPRFADGGQVSTAEPSFAEKAATSSDSKAAGATNVSININVTGGTAETQTQGDTKQGGVDYKKMSEQIKQVVIQTINEEKRLGGSLRSR